MSYLSEVLTDAPLAFWRLDEIAGTTMADSSGNARDQTYINVGAGVSLGGASGIETDASSKAIVTSIRASIIPATSGALNLNTSFTWEVWAKPTGGSGSRAVLSKGGGTGTWHHALYLTSANFWKFHLSLGAGPTAYSVTSSTAAVIGSWYHLVAIRNGTTMSLYVNGVLSAQRTDLPLSDTLFGPQDFWVAATGGGTASVAEYFVGNIDELALYSTILSGARILAHYEAGKASLPLRTTMAARSTFTLNTNQVPLVAFPFAHNWLEALGGGQSPVTETISYMTDTLQSYTNYEQRVNLRSYSPFRTLRYQITPDSYHNRALLHDLLWAPGQTYLLPIWNDWTTATAQANAGDSTINVDTVGRDFDAGARAMLWSSPITYEVVTIQTVGASSITITGTLASTWASGSVIVPVRRAVIPDDVSFASHLRDRETATIEFDLLGEEIATNRAATYTPSLTHKSLEVFTLANVVHDWVEENSYQLLRPVKSVESATNRGLQFAGDTGSRRTASVRLLYTDRASISQFLGWLANRQGRQVPFWLISGEADMVVTARPGTFTLTINDIGYTQYYNVHNARRDIAILKTDGTYTFARITAAADAGATETLTVDSTMVGITSNASNVTRTSFMRLVRLHSDDVKLTWLTGNADRMLECTLTFVDVLASDATP